MNEAPVTKKRLAIILSKVPVFENPKVRLEQYPTDSEVAADLLWRAHQMGDISGKVCADPGCGTGILGIGMLIMGAKGVYFSDIDSDAVEQAKKSVKKLKSEGFEGTGKSYFQTVDVDKVNNKVDTVVQNPPFGAKVRHRDRRFLLKSFEIAETVYTLAKSESENFVSRFAGTHGFQVTHTWKYEFPLKQTLKYHTRRIYRTKVSCLRLVALGQA